MLGFCIGRTSDSTESLYEDFDEDPKFKTNHLGSIKDSVAVFVTGKFAGEADRFIIDFCLDNEDKDIALRVAFRASTNTVGLNSRKRYVWGCVETSSAVLLNLQKDYSFEIEILFTNKKVMIAFNTLHIAKIKHRVAMESINSIEIRGDLSDIAVARNLVTEYPTRPKKSPNLVRLSGVYAETSNEDDLEPAAASDETDGVDKKFLPLPFYAAFAKGFINVGYSVGVTGLVGPNPKMFKMVLQAGQNVWPEPNIALLLEISFLKDRVGDNSVVRNSYVDGKWAGQKRIVVTTGLRTGKAFHLVVTRGVHAFEILMNNRPITDYTYRFDPTSVDTCYITGDIHLINVEIENNAK